MGWWDELFKLRIARKKLAIIDANASDLDHYKELFERKGYIVTSILVVDQNLSEFSNQTTLRKGGINAGTVELLKHAQDAGKAVPYVGQADYWAKTGQDMADRIQQIEPDFILTDRWQQEEENEKTLNHRTVPIVLHSGIMTHKGFSAEHIVDEYYATGAGSAAITVPKDTKGQCVDNILQALARRQENVPVESLKAALLGANMHPQ